MALGLVAGLLPGPVQPWAAAAEPAQEAGEFDSRLQRALDGPGFVTGQDIVSLTIAPSVDLQPLSIAELLGTASGSIDLGTWMPGADPTLGVTPQPIVMRGVDALWSAWISGSSNQIDVQFSLVGLNGEPDCLSLPGAPGQKLPVTLVARPPVQIDRDKKLKLFEGGADLVIDTSLATVAGTYGGVLVVTVNQF